MKKCTKCKEYLSLESFGKNRAKPDGLASECSLCKLITDKIPN